ncbi:MAG TPA: terminase family protein, partial [Candidatus Paceibacterota bacterium]
MSQLDLSLNLNLHPKQGVALFSKATEILYGGAAGGGKSFLMRVMAIMFCTAISGLQVYIFRRISADLIKNHMEGPKGLRAMLAPWVMQGYVTIVESEIRFWNGSKIYLCHCEHEKNIYNYQGAEIHLLLIDEITHFTETMYRFLRNRVRMVGVNVPEQYRGMFPRILCGGNPGNIGHLWVKAAFVDAAPEMEIRKMPPADGGMLRQYIPARLEDNPSMEEDDPGYEQRLEGLGSAALVRAMRHGDWSVIEGAY